jgi:probable rRNA maturation factor
VSFRREGRDSALLFAFCAALGVCPRTGETAGEKDLVILQKKVAGLSADTLERFVLRARRAVSLAGTVNVLVTTSAAVRSLNRQFRSQNKATDVLSFPSTSAESKSRQRPALAGDVAISADIALQNAIRLGHPASKEIKILALHGILHLAGFDHERDNGEMARTEAILRRTLRLPAALIERVHHEQIRPARFRPARFRPAMRQSSKLRRSPPHAKRARKTA